MNRKSFLRVCGAGCLGMTFLVASLESCGTTKRIYGDIVGSDMLVPLSAFAFAKKGGVEYRNSIIVQHEDLQDPICVFREKDGKSFTALLMRCTHQGAQLQLFGDKFACPAHGSEFDYHGQIQQGPAESNLRSFPTLIENQQLRISLQ